MPGSPAYERRRRGWNAAIDQRPHIIVECADAEDVRQAVQFAAAHDASIAVRGGGHSIAGHSSADRSVLLDLARFKKIQINPVDRTVAAGGGATWGEMVAATAPHQLATPGGFNPDVGIGGLTLGGGYGALTRLFGLACDNLIDVELINAQGGRVTVDEHRDPELFWALRGAGANFGVATSLRYKLHSIPPLYGGHVAYPLQRCRELLHFYRDYVAGLSDATTAYLGMRRQRSGSAVAFVAALHAGPTSEAEHILAPLRRFSTPMIDDFAPRTYAAIHQANVGAFPSGLGHYWRAHFLQGLTDPVLNIIAEHTSHATDADFYTVIEHLGGAMGRVAPQATAFAHRDATFGIAITTQWQLEEDPADSMRWVRELHQALIPESSGGVYVNYVGADAAPTTKHAVYGANYERLVQLKRRYDPANLFRHNVNIDPLQSGNP
ncbi:MAG TPA: FAD-binding oxidoreductase [Gammaproteobacteria bacterium]|nr:FAD-binding oxidoreductase [Gammaproteobacteria bacterium]